MPRRPQGKVCGLTLQADSGPTVLHVSTGLGRGGAEHTLYKLCLAGENPVLGVVSLGSLGHFGPLLVERGIPVYELNLGRSNLLLAILKTRAILKSLNPDVLQTWMPHANFIGTLAARSLGMKRIIWGVRATNYHYGFRDWFNILMIGFLALMSHWWHDPIF
jgi:hypothetical protein